MICNVQRLRQSLRNFKFDILDVGFIFLIGFLTYQGHTLHVVCSSGGCGF